MVAEHRQIFAFSGIRETEDDRLANFDLVQHAMTLTGKESGQRVCYVPTGVGDAAASVESKRTQFARERPDIDFTALTLFPQPSVPDLRAHLLAQDLILVEGGSVVNLMALWRVHGLDEVMRECWEAGVVLCGPSAGSLCWHVGGPTDSFSDDLHVFTEGLAFLPFSNGVHDDFDDQPRREVYRALVAKGAIPAGYATEDGVGLHYLGTSLHEAVSIRPRAKAWWVTPDGAGGYREEPVPPRLL